MKRLLGPPVQRALSRLTAAMNMQPRQTLGLVLACVTLILVATPTGQATADEKDGCGGGALGLVCSGAHGVGLGGLWDRADSTMKTIDALNPANFLDTWAQGLCSSVVFILAFIESLAEKLGQPAYNQQWWASQYAVSFGLAVIVLAFLLLVVTTRLGASDGAVSSVELLRQSGWRLMFVIPGCAAGPAVLYSVQQLAAALTKSFADRSAKEGHGAIGELMKVLKENAGDWGEFGGTILVIFMMAFILLAAIILLVEMAVSNWGLTLAGLILPLALVASVYPPWSRILKRLCLLIGGLMATPVAVFFFFWTIWSGFKSLTTDGDSSNSAFSMVLFLLVSLIMIDFFPFVAAWLLNLSTGGSAETMEDVRETAPAPSGGEVYSKIFTRRVERDSSDGDDGGSSGSRGPGAEGSHDSHVEDEPEDSDGPTAAKGSGASGGSQTSAGGGGPDRDAARGSEGGTDRGDAGASTRGAGPGAAEGGTGSNSGDPEWDEKLDNLLRAWNQQKAEGGGS